MTCWGLGHTFTWGGSASSDVPPLSLRCQCGLLCRGDLPADVTLAEVARLQAENDELRAEQEDDRRAWGRDSVAWELAVEGLKEENERLTEQLRIATEALEAIQNERQHSLVIDTTNARMGMVPHNSAAAPAPLIDNRIGPNFGLPK